MLRENDYKKLTRQQKEYLKSLSNLIRRLPPERKWVYFKGEVRTYASIVKRIETIFRLGYYEEGIESKFMNDLKEVYVKLKKIHHEQEE